MLTPLNLSPQLPGYPAVFGPKDTVLPFLSLWKDSAKNSTKIQQLMCQIYSAEDLPTMQECIALHFQLRYLFNLCSCWFILARLKTRCFCLVGWFRLLICDLHDCSFLGEAKCFVFFVFCGVLGGFLSHKELLDLWIFLFFSCDHVLWGF